MLRKLNGLLFIVTLLLVTSCATSFDIKESESATLKNTLDTNSKDEFIYLFKSIDGTELNAGLFGAASSSEFEVPSGNKTVTVQLLHSPNKVKWGSAVSGVRQYQETFSFDVALTPSQEYRAVSEIEVGGRAHVWLVDKYGEPVTSKKSEILKSIKRSTVIPVMVPGVPFVPLVY